MATKSKRGILGQISNSIYEKKETIILDDSEHIKTNTDNIYDEEINDELEEVFPIEINDELEEVFPIEVNDELDEIFPIKVNDNVEHPINLKKTISELTAAEYKIFRATGILPLK